MAVNYLSNHLWMNSSVDVMITTRCNHGQNVGMWKEWTISDHLWVFWKGRHRHCRIHLRVPNCFYSVFCVDCGGSGG